VTAAAEPYDLVVIGSGPGGYVAAIRASQLGFRVAIVEKADLGGVCLNWGCIPTKALLHAAEVVRTVRSASQFGVSSTAPVISLEAMIGRSRSVAGRLSAGVDFLMRKHRIDVVRGSGAVEKGRPFTVRIRSEAGERALPARRVLIATGARAREFPEQGLKADGRLVWTYREALTPDCLPQRLLIIGSGAIGVEFASFYSALGSEVSLVESQDTILPLEDREISGLMAKRLAAEGVRVMTSAKVTLLKPAADCVETSVEIDGGPVDLETDRVILAIGIVGNTEGLGLEALGVRIERSHIVTDAVGRTAVEGVYAIGDVAGPPWLAHKAMHEGVACVEAMAAGAQARTSHESVIPSCVYAHPQIASMGLTEEAARRTGRKLKIGRFPALANGKAIAMGAEEGLVKTIFDAETGELLGAHLIGEGVSELIQGFVIARQGELTEAELMGTVFAHPTISEMMHESVLAAYGRALHI
jgi:dihydrolipoamide dehydrogenase